MATRLCLHLRIQILLHSLLKSSFKSTASTFTSTVLRTVPGGLADGRGFRARVAANPISVLRITQPCDEKCCDLKLIPCAPPQATCPGSLRPRPPICCKLSTHEAWRSSFARDVAVPVVKTPRRGGQYPTARGPPLAKACRNQGIHNGRSLCDPKSADLTILLRCARCCAFFASPLPIPAVLCSSICRLCCSSSQMRLGLQTEGHWHRHHRTP